MNFLANDLCGDRSVYINERVFLFCFSHMPNSDLYRELLSNPHTYNVRTYSVHPGDRINRILRNRDFEIRFANVLNCY